MEKKERNYTRIILEVTLFWENSILYFITIFVENKFLNVETSKDI